MPLEIKLLAVPHLKGLINGKICLVGKSMGVVLNCKNFICKVLILLHPWKLYHIEFGTRMLTSTHENMYGIKKCSFQNLSTAILMKSVV